MDTCKAMLCQIWHQAVCVIVNLAATILFLDLKFITYFNNYKAYNTATGYMIKPAIILSFKVCLARTFWIRIIKSGAPIITPSSCNVLKYLKIGSKL
jgi:hypothetical protein